MTTHRMVNLLVSSPTSSAAVIVTKLTTVIEWSSRKFRGEEEGANFPTVVNTSELQDSSHFQQNCNLVVVLRVSNVQTI